MPEKNIHQDSALLDELRLFVRLRWGAAAAVVVGALANSLWLKWFDHSYQPLYVGLAIFGYNALFSLLVRSLAGGRQRSSSLAVLAWGQILPDLACLTLLTAWTGGVRSPMLGFYVFHMVIASMLLPHPTAYGGVAASGIMLLMGLKYTGQWPPQRLDSLILIGWLIMLLAVVYLASHITRSLSRHRSRLLRQKRRIRAMSDELRRQNQAMVQQDKMAAMGVLAAGVAHEITNPLASMDSLLQLIQRRPDRANGEALWKMKEQIDRINQTVRQLTHFAHPGDARRQRISIDRIVARTLKMVQYDRRLQDVRLDIRKDVPAQAGWVVAQPHAVEQVLVNLILNALDAMADEPHPRLN
ncbi:MAG: sensor histidine kinase, partial [Planctomycetota bacterium]